jgi:hypothetical protein
MQLSETARAVVERYRADNSGYLAVSADGAQAAFAWLDRGDPFDMQVYVCTVGGTGHCPQTKRFGDNAMLAALETCRLQAGSACVLVSEEPNLP